MKPWVACQIVRATRPYDQDVAAVVDRKVCVWADRKSGYDLVGIAEAAIIESDPAAAREREQAAAKATGVWLDQSTHHGTKTMIVKADAADLIRFDATIDRVADDLKILGDPRTQDQRRAAAFGVLADPQTALNLRTDAYATYTGQPAPGETGSRRHRTRR